VVVTLTASTLTPNSFTLDNLVGGTTQSTFDDFTPPITAPPTTLPTICNLTYDIVIPADLSGVVSIDPTATKTLAIDLSPAKIDGNYTI
jgi:hypothetical protein